MKVNSVMGLLLAVEAGVGLAALPEYLVSNSNNIIKVLPNSEGPIQRLTSSTHNPLKTLLELLLLGTFCLVKLVIGNLN